MEGVLASARLQGPIDAEQLAAASARAADEIRGNDREPVVAIEAAIGAFADAVAGVLPSVFVLEHGRLWLAAQRGYAVVPDGITVESGITGRSIRLGSAQLATDVRADPDYVAALPGVRSEISVPLRTERGIVGVLNVESERVLPEAAGDALQPLALALTSRVEALQASRTLDLAALARLFVHLGSLRNPKAIAELGAASLPRVLPVAASQIVVWDDVGSPTELATWSSGVAAGLALDKREIDVARARVESSVVCDVLELPGRKRADPKRSIVWLPLRANAKELGALVGVGRGEGHVDPTVLDAAAVLAAHVATSLDAAFALQRARVSATTDALTGILNRRGLEERIERGLATAQEQRRPLSLLVLDCDDFKQINDRAGHQFGDTLLREIADVLVQSVPRHADAARLGGDEFVVMLPGAGVDTAEKLGTEIRRLLAEGLTDAGFPLRISGGVATYPFDGATTTALLRAADQALYAAKIAGKNRIASFRDLTWLDPGQQSPVLDAGGARRGHGSGAVLADAIAATRALEAEETVEGVCTRLCKALVFLVGATACTASRVQGEYLVDATGHALREIWLGDETAYRIADFPLTGEVLRTGQARAVSFADGGVDPAEAFILRQLGMSALLMVPLRVHGHPWGLIELYEMRLRRFSDDDVAMAEFLADHAQRRLEVVGETDDPGRPPRIFELPSS